MGDEPLISGIKRCEKCRSGLYRFAFLSIKRVDYGRGTKFLEYKCEKCGHTINRAFNVETKPEQIAFNLYVK